MYIWAITGAIAGAFYGVPKEIEQNCRLFLYERLTNILDEFNKHLNLIKNNKML